MEEDDHRFDFDNVQATDTSFVTPPNSTYGTPDTSQSGTPNPQRRITTSETTPTPGAGSGRRRPRKTSESSGLGGTSFGQHRDNLDDVFSFDAEEAVSSTPTRKSFSGQGSTKSRQSNASNTSQTKTSSRRQSRTSSESGSLGDRFESNNFHYLKSFAGFIA